LTQPFAATFLDACEIATGDFMYQFPNIRGLVVAALCLVAPAGRASATVLLNDFDGASKSNPEDILRDAAGLSDAASGSLGVGAAIGAEVETLQIALAAPPIEMAWQQRTLLSDATDEPLVDVDSLDYKLFGVSLLDAFIETKNY
jgi:hypothetical protein